VQILPMSIRLSIRSPLSGLLGAAMLTATACTPAPTPAPAPEREPTAAEQASARADSARAVMARAERDARARAAAAAERRAAQGRFVDLARPATRTDTLVPRPVHGPVRVCAGGDVTLGTNLDTAWARKASRRMRREFHRSDDPLSLVAPLRSLFGGADLVLVNVESAIGEGPTPSKCRRRERNCFAFRAPIAAAAALRSIAPKARMIGNVANNHSRDAGSPGHLRTVEALERAGVLVTGDDTLPTLVPTPTGDTIAVLGFYTSSDTPDVRDTAAVRRYVSRAANRYPIVIVTMHLGAEGIGAQHVEDSTEVFLGIDRGNPVAFAEAAVRGGATLVIGHGPHVLRAMEWTRNGALIAYSLGNLLTYGPFVLGEPLDRGAVLCATVDTTGRVAAATIIPTVQRVVGVIARDRSGRALAIVDSLGQVDLPASAARVDTDGALIPRQPR
jgi:poly-gamma-glutamate capsule biosynthesis protein CapA/YwtB (metallophosphatase superfamily)